MSNEITRMDIDEFNRLKNVRFKSTRRPSFQQRAILRMELDEAIVLDHGDYKCVRHGIKYSCGLQNLVARLQGDSQYKYQTLHVDDGERVAVAYTRKFADSPNGT
jgi:hypothetical protein